MSVKSVLSGMEWDEGLQVPVANASNKQLEELLQKNQQEMTKLNLEVAQTEDRVFALQEHMRNVQQELNNTQGISRAREKEIETENHMLLVAQREEGRLKQEIQRLENNLADLQERKNIHENSIFKNTQKLEEMKSQLKWDQQALEAWLEESARKDEDAMTLAKYSQLDDAKIKELSLRMEKMTEDAQRKRKNLNHEMTETLTAQLELDKTAEEFRKAHNDRQDLIAQWEATIEQMQRRDREMDRLALQLAEAKANLRNNEDQVNEKRSFLENEMENNQEQQKQIQQTDRLAARLRQDHQQNENQRIQFQDEVETLKFTVERTATDLEGMRRQVNELKKEVEEKKARVELAKKNRGILMDKLKAASNATISAEEKAAIMDNMLENEEEDQKLMEQELKRLRDLQYKKSQELYEAKVLEKNTGAGIQGGRAASRNLSSRINKLDHDSLKQQEIIYNQDFAIQQLERKIARLQGERSTEEMDALNAKIKELTAALDERNNTHTLLNTQLKRLQDDIRRVKRELEKGGAEKDDLTSKIEELNLHNDSSQRELKRIINAKQNLMVDDNILKLEIKRLRDMLNNKADTVFSLEKRRLQLDTAMKERHHEIGIHKDMLKAQLKTAEEERSTVSTELHERINKIDKLRKRYEILMVSMAPPEGEAEEEMSQAYYVIKAAQEKEQLQRKGDELDAKIRKAEKEIKALENTLRLMNGRNEQYRKSFNRVTETNKDMTEMSVVQGFMEVATKKMESTQKNLEKNQKEKQEVDGKREEYEEKQRLDEQLRAAMDKYKYKRRQIREFQDDLQTMSNTMENLTRDESAYEEMVEEKQNKVQQLSKEIEEQKSKIERASKLVVKYARDVRSAQKVKGETHEERDFDLREMRDFNKNIMKQVGEVIHQHGDVAPSAHMLFSQASLPVPPPPSASGMRTSRSGSSISVRSVLSPKTPSSGRSAASSRAGSVTAIKTVDLSGLSAHGSRSGSPKEGRSPTGSASRLSTGRRESRPASAASSKGSARSMKL